METRYVFINEQIKLAYSERYNKESSIGIILVHGLGEHKGRYKDFIEKMYDMRISVFAIDIRGHGESGGRRGDIEDFNIYLSDLDFFVKKVKHDHPNIKLALLGHSLGGLIASGYVERYANVDFLVLSNPLLSAPEVAKILNIIPYQLLYFIKVKKRHSESAEMLAYSYNDPLASNFFTIRLLGVIFKQGISLVAGNLSRIKIPVLLLGGTSDPLIQTNKFERLLYEFGGADRELKMYQNVKHRLLQSDRKDDVMKDIAAWLQQHIS